jgi:hypothetical protein
VVASTGEEALPRADELHPDVTLIDIDLGDSNGFGMIPTRGSMSE